MPFLRINGIEVPVANDEAEETPEEIGVTDERALDGSSLDSRRAVKGSWKLKTTPQVPATGHAFKQLLLGAGHSWDFEDPRGFYSWNGLAYDSKDAGVTIDTAHALFGTKSMKLNATGDKVQFAALVGAVRWTVAIFVWDAGTALFRHVLINDNGDVWVNGVSAAMPAVVDVTVTNGVVKLENADAGSIWIDELLILPYRVPADWPLQMFRLASVSLKSVPPLHHLYADGSFIENGLEVKTVRAKVGAVKPSQGTIGGVWYPNLLSVEAELFEV
jgi:hypothetical protein